MDTIRKLLESIGTSSGTELYVKLGLLAVAGIAAIWYLIYKRKARKDKASRERERDRQQNASDNSKTEDQNTSSGRNVRNRLRGK